MLYQMSTDGSPFLCVIHQAARRHLFRESVPARRAFHAGMLNFFIFPFIIQKKKNGEHDRQPTIMYTLVSLYRELYSRRTACRECWMLFMFREPDVLEYQADCRSIMECISPSG